MLAVSAACLSSAAPVASSFAAASAAVSASWVFASGGGGAPFLPFAGCLDSFRELASFNFSAAAAIVFSASCSGTAALASSAATSWRNAPARSARCCWASRRSLCVAGSALRTVSANAFCSDARSRIRLAAPWRRSWSDWADCTCPSMARAPSSTFSCAATASGNLPATAAVAAAEAATASWRSCASFIAPVNPASFAAVGSALVFCMASSAWATSFWMPFCSAPSNAADLRADLLSVAASFISRRLTVWRSTSAWSRPCIAGLRALAGEPVRERAQQDSGCFSAPGSRRRSPSCNARGVVLAALAARSAIAPPPPCPVSLSVPSFLQRVLQPGRVRSVAALRSAAVIIQAAGPGPAGTRASVGAQFVLGDAVAVGRGSARRRQPRPCAAGRKGGPRSAGPAARRLRRRPTGRQGKGRFMGGPFGAWRNPRRRSTPAACCKSRRWRPGLAAEDFASIARTLTSRLRSARRTSFSHADTHARAGDVVVVNVASIQ